MKPKVIGCSGIRGEFLDRGHGAGAQDAIVAE
jgi:hypothetical protein